MWRFSLCESGIQVQKVLNAAQAEQPSGAHCDAGKYK